MTAFGDGAQLNWCCVSPGQNVGIEPQLHSHFDEVIVTVLTHMWMNQAMAASWRSRSDSYRVNTPVDAEAWAVARESKTFYWDKLKLHKI